MVNPVRMFLAFHPRHRRAISIFHLGFAARQVPELWAHPGTTVSYRAEAMLRLVEMPFGTPSLDARLLSVRGYRSRNLRTNSTKVRGSEVPATVAGT